MKTKNKIILVSLLVLTLMISALLIGCNGNDDDKKWKVTFNYNYTGAPSAVFTEIEVKDGEKAAEPSPAPTRSGYDFEGWFTDAACAASSAFAFTTEIKADTTLYAGWKAEEVEPPLPGDVNVKINYASKVTDYEGTWNVKKVYLGGDNKETKDAVANAITMKIELDYDPSELVDDAEYIHNKLYNLDSTMTFGLDGISVTSYTGKSMWDKFSLGQVSAYGEWYKQPGPAIMDFGGAMRDNGLFLDLVAGVSSDIDTENKELIIGMNDDGQLLLGYSDVALEYPEITGDWYYCLIFDKAE